MASGAAGGVVERLRRAVLRSDAASLSDGQLLERFLRDRDESAFESLVRRHGPMVLGVCRRVLHNLHDAEDAFQAVFLVLVRKAGSLRARNLLASWLYGVAFRTALKARGRNLRRQTAPIEDMVDPRAPTAEATSELRSVLDQELGRLPESYRVPIILCDLEGKTRKEAAAQFGWPEGTLSTRLDRGRQLLAQRLARRGMAVAAGPLALALAQQAATAAAPAALFTSTVKAATLVAAGQAATAGVISAKVAALTEGVLHAMFIAKLKSTALVLAIVGLIGTGVGVTTRYVLATDPPERPAAQTAEQDGRGGDVVKDESVRGKVVEVSKDGKAVSLEMPSDMRGVEPTRKVVQITDKSEVMYFGVPIDGAKPTVGYQAQVWAQKDSSDAAAKIHFTVLDRTRGRGFQTGKVVAVAADGKSITLEQPASRQPGDVRKVDIHLTKDTKITYAFLLKSDGKPKEGYIAEVWLDDSSREALAAHTATKVVFTDSTRDRSNALNGKVVALSKEGGTLTLETAPTERGGAPGRKDVKLTVATDITFRGVGPDGAKLTEGYAAHVWLYEDMPDTAAKVMLMKPGSGVRGR
jgi:RNA polymerase sigma factor (sigma-70 family)